jgi:hypothetical protein
MKAINSNNNTQIFATGVHLQAVECTINGIKQWRWIAVNFEDDSFLNGENVQPIEYADVVQGLLKPN